MRGVDRRAKERAKGMGFGNISIIGRVAYCIYSLEVFLLEKGYGLKSFDGVFRALWSFADTELPDYEYKVIECRPDTLFDDGEDFKSFNYFSENELLAIKKVYEGMDKEHLNTVNYIMENIGEMLSAHMYTSNKVPAQFSLDLMEKEVIPYIKSHVENYPSMDMFLIYNIEDNQCWGRLYSKEYLLQKLYLSNLEKMFPDTIRVIEEAGCISDIILDGTKEEFYLSFRYAGRVDVCWNNEMFIFDKGRDLLTSEDTFHEIVYEDVSLLSDSQRQASLVIQILSILSESTFVSKQEIETGEETPFGYDTRKEYIINISKKETDCNEWVFGNIKIRCE